ncbi:TetR/AcrR family transcriptional regulator [Nocardia brasiliensis]|uniref:TetR/AcrR family transcriptional regulator n=1 Tax=Nocardia brasiliensis TaxID=37326 RepID=UPI001895A051|nr:TetR/AcrR family transcriptional regulator [Nocardia brasiliensis]MBF6127296.1 TetR/AcrR family transcriptional regulator [Nocardia brasiliensis]
MARPRQFDEERAVDAAMRAFWIAGYEATSTQALCEATGLGRSSIYNTFTSKRDLFERALRRYMTTKNATTFELLDSDLDAKAKMRALLWQVVDAPEADPLGCLVVNSMVELAPHDAEVAATLREDQRRRLAALRDALESGRRAGEIDNSKSADQLAHFMNATIAGMRVAARGGASRDALAAIATTALDAF